LDLWLDSRPFFAIITNYMPEPLLPILLCESKVPNRGEIHWIRSISKAGFCIACKNKPRPYN
jgi:hypothetical protein